MGASVVFGFPGESAVDYVTRQGLTVISDLSNAELFAKYGRRPDGTSSLPASMNPQAAAAVRYCVARVPYMHPRGLRKKR